MDELVALYDADGRPAGSAPRSRMRAENLRHAATAVVVRDPWGRVYVHRRTDTKDVYPGLHDFTAGGVVAAGEEPLSAALRELEEELGVGGVTLEPIGEGDYADAHTDYRGFGFVTWWDGPVRWQPEEVAWGDWVTLDRLAAWLAEAPGDFVPDARGLWGGWLTGRLAARRTPEQGWDTEAEVVEERWLDRRPRRPEVAPRLRAEAALLPRLAPLLPLAVPVPVVLDEDPLRVRHVLVPGEPCRPERLTAEDGALVGRFLRVLHGTGRATWADSGVTDGAAGRAELLTLLRDLSERVLPLLPAGRRDEGARLLEAVAEPGPVTLVHGDLGPDHLLVTDGRVSGVIDWCDARILDPGLDLAWTLHGTPEAFAEALATAYAVDDRLRARGLLWRRLGPWHEVLHGLDHGGEEYVASGLAGVLDRLG